MKIDQKRWDERFKGKKLAFGKEPNPFLKKYLRLVPRGKALDIAAGEGRNAVFLAMHGFDVDAVDISERGLQKARKLAKEAGVRSIPFSPTLKHISLRKNDTTSLLIFTF